jgi:hypothetical protein
MTDLERTPTAPVEAMPEVPGEWNALYRLAQRIAPTSFVPKAMRGKPGEVLACFLHGHELGLPPITALRSIHVIDGTPTASAQLMRGLILQHGHILQWREVTSERVVLYGRRRDTGSDALVTWTMDDARRAKLVGKGNWATYPRAMLAARATSEIARLLFADLLHGLAYTPEEVGVVGPFDAIDINYRPDVDRETGEILDPDVVDEDTPPHQVVADVFDAEDALDGEWLQQARQEES